MNDQYNAIVGGSHPNHFIKLPSVEDKETIAKFIEEQTKRFIGDNAVEELAEEIKLSIITF